MNIKEFGTILRKGIHTALRLYIILAGKTNRTKNELNTKFKKLNILPEKG